MDVILADGTSVLLIDLQDLNTRSTTHYNRVRTVVEAARAEYDVIVFQMTTSMGLRALPHWLREYPLNPVNGRFGSCWVMEKDDKGLWLKPDLEDLLRRRS